MNAKVQGIVARLANGERVENSMVPRINSKQPVTVEAGTTFPINTLHTTLSFVVAQPDSDWRAAQTTVALTG